jgi:mRNA-degrading endonuclease toxin of MazEF toxin-antitoxin module
VLLTWYDELKTSMIQTEQLATVDKGAVLGYITHLREEDMVRLDRALLASLGMDIYLED